MYVSYLWLRVGMGALAFLLPILVVGSYAAQKHGFVALGSLSEYYRYGLAGRFFTGSLFAVGTGLLLYQGFTPEEENALNGAGLCAFVVALVPHDSFQLVHIGAAVLLFILLAYVAMRRAGDTLEGYTAARRRIFYLGYRVCGYAMLAGIGLALLLGAFGFRGWVILAEVLGIYGFGAYWALKSQEMRLRTARDLRVLENV
jgi:hypothetical protein